MLPRPHTGLRIVFVVLVSLGGLGSSDVGYYTEQTDSWFNPQHPHSKTYWRDQARQRLWLPNIMTDEDSPLHVLAPPERLNLSVATIPQLNWYDQDFCFFFITNTSYPHDPGMLLYISKDDLRGVLRLEPTIASKQAPLLEVSSRDVFQTPGLQYTPAVNSLLRSRSWISYAPTDNEVEDLPRGVNTATPNHPYGQKHIPIAPPPFNRMTPILLSLTSSAIINATNTWFNGAQLLRPPHRRIYKSSSTATWPIVIWDIGAFTLKCDAAFTHARYGHDFMGLTISMHDSQPVEIFVTPDDVEILSISRLWFGAQISLPGPEAGPNYRVFWSSPITPQKNEALFQALRDAVAYPEESGDYIYPITKAYVTIFEHARAGFAPPPQPTLFWRLSSLLATSGFNFINTVRELGSIRVSDFLNYFSHLRILSRFAAQAAGCATPSPTINPEIFDGPTFTELRKKLHVVLKEMMNDEDHRSAYVRAHQLAFALGDLESYNIVAESALQTVRTLYKKFLSGDPLTSVAVRRALFFAGAVLLLPLGHDNPTAEQRERTRQSLMLHTAMCTADVIAHTDAAIQAAMDQADPDRANFLWDFEHASPCMNSMRFDITEETFLFDTLATIPRSNISTQTILEETAGVVAALSPRAYHSDLIRAFISEASMQCLSQIQNRDVDAHVLIPITSNSSYIVTKSPVSQGIHYTLDGVDVKNPLFLTYFTPACVEQTQQIESKRLVRVESSTDIGLVGSVFLRYTPAGEVTSVILVDTPETQRQLVDDPQANTDLFGSDMPSTALLLFPNGTVVHLLSFDTVAIADIPAHVIFASVVGVVLALLALYGIVRVIILLVPILCKRD
ncbi:glycoprotein H [Macropodid alphaherpesvirus 2]|uniref:Glycoprotein H n=1 Tax=Macropodid alphaherpesvirus 2 TaxID=83440 RepID=A0AAE7SYB8_9ALPH|nr:glycoprotein H [Macropodid alphaherpesvirus 2]QOD40197.1 glycoprotein H [Macropodid alphaherpesvirus 2]WGO49742.1 glycoprotein H [Macropodid alphaherpesvirus 2]